MSPFQSQVPDTLQFLRDNDLMAIASPVTTGMWEFKLRDMEQGKFPRGQFMGEINALTREVVDRVRSIAKMLPAPAAKKPLGVACPKCQKPILADDVTFSCECGFKVWRQVAGHALTEQEGLQLIAQGALPTLSGFTSAKKKPFAAGLRLAVDLSGKVDFMFEERSEVGAAEAAVKCPQCGKPMRRRQGGKSGGYFWGCTGYPDCKHTMDDKDGTPVPKQAGSGRVSAGKSGDTCPTCRKGKLIGRQNGQGQSFIGCTKYPTCRHYEWVTA